MNKLLQSAYRSLRAFRRNRRGNDRRSRHQDDSDEPTGNVVAFGDNVPAFLRIPVPVSRKAS